MSAQRVVELTYEQLLSDDDLSAQLEEAYGPGGLGIATVSGVPDFADLRRALLPQAARLADLPADKLAALEDPASCFNIGWSCGRESLERGACDSLKGSFYFNPAGTPSHQWSDADARRHPAYCRPNLWPSQELPELESAATSLGSLITSVGLLLARHADRMCAARGLPPRLHDILTQSPCHKARLLHYFAPAAASAGGTSWCGWHTDHGSLTGLCSAMYLDRGREVACPDPHAGLHVRVRPWQGDGSGSTVQVCIPADHIGFQVGEALQVHSGGRLRATPHCVVAPRTELSAGVTRSTLAVFMQPAWHCALNAPAGATAEDVGVPNWRPDLNFGEFAKLRFESYYDI